MTIEELKKIKNEIDWETLQDQVIEILRYPVKLNIFLKETESPGIGIESEELTMHSGIMNSVFDSIKLKSSDISFSDEGQFMDIELELYWINDRTPMSEKGKTSFLSGTYNMEAEEWIFV